MKPYRWKVACINWSLPEAPKAAAYAINEEGVAIYDRYFLTHAEAIAFADDAARRTHRLLHRILDPNPSQAVPIGAASLIQGEEQP